MHACTLPPASLLVRLAVNYVHACHFSFWRLLYLDVLGARCANVPREPLPLPYCSLRALTRCQHAAARLIAETASTAKSSRAEHSEFPPSLRSLRSLTKGKKGAKPAAGSDRRVHRSASPVFVQMHQGTCICLSDGQANCDPSLTGQIGWAKAARWHCGQARRQGGSGDRLDRLDWCKRR